MDLVLSRMVEDAVGPGEFSQKIIKEAKERFQFEHAIAFRSPYLAIVKALKVCGLAAGALVGISALAPSWHRAAVEDAGFEPIVLDVDAQSFHPSFETIIGARIQAMVFFDALGQLPPQELIKAIQMPALEDISQAFGASEGERMPGDGVTFAVWGFEDDAPLATGGGALLCTRNRRDASVLRNLDAALPDALKMTDYNAALGVSQLKSATLMLERRRSLMQMYRAQLARTRHKTVGNAEVAESAIYAFAVMIEGSMKEAADYARKHGVETKAAFLGSPALDDDRADTRYPTARSIALRCLLFPMHHKMTKQQADQVGKVLATLP
ncbi:MAG: DegT/DnrJ/EryC1/StrS family aminotransferase [Rectinema sp.]|nr:DegT/DnrJ/EryC1/StrS family aminotransferase [Rectinema sp.]